MVKELRYVVLDLDTALPRQRLAADMRMTMCRWQTAFPSITVAIESADQAHLRISGFQDGLGGGFHKILQHRGIDAAEVGGEFQVALAQIR